MKRGLRTPNFLRAENYSAANVGCFLWKMKRARIQRVEPRALAKNSQTAGLVLSNQGTGNNTNAGF